MCISVTTTQIVSVLKMPLDVGVGMDLILDEEVTAPTFK